MNMITINILLNKVYFKFSQCVHIFHCKTPVVIDFEYTKHQKLKFFNEIVRLKKPRKFDQLKLKHFTNINI